MALITCFLYKNYVGKVSPDLTLTNSFLIAQKINLLVADSEFQKKRMNGRGRHLEQKIWFLIINQVSAHSISVKVVIY